MASAHNYGTLLDEAVAKVSSSLCDKDWRGIARRLELSDADISSIETDNLNNLKEQIFQVFEMWRKKKGDDATIEVLVEALENENLNNLADFVKKEYCKDPVEVRQITINAQAAIVDLATDMKFEVPENAVLGEVEITVIERDFVDGQTLPMNCTPLMQTLLEFGPDGQRFEKPVIFSYNHTGDLPTDIEEVVALTYSGTKPWTELKTRQGNRVIKAEVEHFSFLVVVSRPAQASGIQKKEEKEILNEREKSVEKAVKIISPRLDEKEWKPTGRKLGITEPDFSVIRIKYPRNFQEQKNEMFRMWLRKERKKATVSRLTTALRSVGLRRLAEDVERDVKPTNIIVSHKQAILHKK